MDLDALRKLIGAFPLADGNACRAELVAVRAARGMLDAREMRLLARLDELAATPAGAGSFPDADLAAASKKGTGAADKIRQRAKVADDVPQLGQALDDGETTGERLDVVARATAGMNDSERARFATYGDRLSDAARDLSDRDFRALAERLAARVREDDGIARLERQKRAMRLRWWTDNEGMWRLDGRFDPESGMRLDSRIRRVVETLFHTGVPDGAPTDPIDRNQFLAAHALLNLADGISEAGGGFSPGAGGPDITVVIDADTLLHGRHDGSRVDIGLGDSMLPIETIRRWACLGTVTPVIVGLDGTRLLLGRERRLANRHQRRALRVWYPTCALCDTPFERCDIHHVHPWETGGPTDMANLLPLCTRHHHLAHEGGWALDLANDRTLTVTRPEGSPTIHGLPTIRAA